MLLLRISIFVVSLGLLVVAERIPSEVRKALRKANNLNDLFGHPNYKFHYHPPHNSHRHKGLHYKKQTISAPPSQPVVLVANPLGHRNKGKDHQSADVASGDPINDENSHTLDEITDSNLILLKNYTQGNDTCMLKEICVPVPMQNEDPDSLIYPRCYQIVKFVYQGNGRFILNQTMNITMEEHQSCSCADCGNNVRLAIREAIPILTRIRTDISIV
ncbi:hypothetical protein WR25_08709 [Diploscapter pachys]|uniref:Spaetzle domain-containing protein n=1 Tax=Diploscapter pachys TaxID=2018661 RepID=A0A2A2LLU0_9BILA|nr:hypothetical protein WR25_08709 [Diploscapter pachys]